MASVRSEITMRRWFQRILGEVTAPVSDLAQAVPAVEAVVRREVARIRADHRLPALARSSRIDSVAAAHSTDMCRRHFFAHVDRDGRGPVERVARDFPEHVGDLAENLFRVEPAAPEPEPVARIIVDGWMASPSHRANLLDPEWEVAGYGIVASSTELFVTQLFSAPVAILAEPLPARTVVGGRLHVAMTLGRRLARARGLQLVLGFSDRSSLPGGDRSFRHDGQPLVLHREGHVIYAVVTLGPIRGPYELLVGVPPEFHPIATIVAA